MSHKPLQEEEKTGIYETIVFGWIMTGMGGDTLENADKARDLLKKLKNSTLQTVASLEILKEEPETLRGAKTYLDGPAIERNKLRHTLKEEIEGLKK